MREPSLLRALVVRLTIVVILAICGGYAMLYIEFRAGLFGLEGQSIAVQVQNLRAAIVPGAGQPRLELPQSAREFYALSGALNGYQLLRADGAVLESGGFPAPYLPVPIAQSTTEIVMQREPGSPSGHSVVAASLPFDDGYGPHWLRVVRSLEDAESLVGQLMLGALSELYPPIILLLIAVIGVVVATVLSSLRSLRAVSRQAAALSAKRLSDRLIARKLPREIVPLVQAVNVALDRLETEYRAQRDFTANAAHELRTPLATLRAQIESRFTAEELGEIGVEIAQLSRLIEQLLCLAHLDSEAGFEHSDFDAHAAAIEVARELAPAALATEHHVMAATPDARVPTEGSASLVRLVFRNLIENAIQHTPGGTSITVSAPDPRTVVIEDDGPGIPAHETPAVFERFRRGQRAAGAGAGLGLAIAQRIMQRHGGQLLLDSSAARGARFAAIFSDSQTPSVFSGSRIQPHSDVKGTS